jgi:hypothetical protein
MSGFNSKGQSQEIRVTGLSTWAKPGFRLSQAALAASSGPAVSIALRLGAIATTQGLSLAVDVGAAAIILMKVATLVLASRERQPKQR